MSAEDSGSGCETEAARMLPWFVTGRLAAAQATRVREHVEHCAICRSDLERERAVRAALRTEARVEHAPQAGLAKTMARIDELARDAPPPEVQPVVASVSRRHPASRWLAAAVVVQAIGLGLLGATLFGRSAAERADAQYRTLATPAEITAASRIRAVFEPETTLGDLRSLLGAAGLVIVDGPTTAGAFTLAAHGVERTGVEAALLRLRGDRRVLFAEPAVNDGGTAR